MPPQATPNDEAKRIFLHRDSNPARVKQFQDSSTGTRTLEAKREKRSDFLHRDSNPVHRVRAGYPDQLDYRGIDVDMVPAPLLVPTCLTTEVVHIRLNQRQPPRPDRVACRTMTRNESTTDSTPPPDAGSPPFAGSAHLRPPRLPQTQPPPASLPLLYWHNHDSPCLSTAKVRRSTSIATHARRTRLRACGAAVAAAAAAATAATILQPTSSHPSRAPSGRSEVPPTRRSRSHQLARARYWAECPAVAAPAASSRG